VVGGTTIPLAPGAYLVIVGDAAIAPAPGILGDYEFYGGVTDGDNPAVPNLTKVAGTGSDMFLGNSGEGITLSTGVSAIRLIPCAEVVDGVSF